MTPRNHPRRPALAGAALAALLTLPVAATSAPAVAAPGTASTVVAERGHHHAEPIVIAHRGASGYRPEHTLAAYELAVRMGADYIEPDVVSTKDGVLVARHENEIGGTTDVADHPEFADRRTTKTIDGNQVTGWFTEDFTLAELETLRAKERLPQVRPQSAAYDGRFRVPTLEQVVDLAERLSRQTGRRIGIAPETKHPSYFDSIGLSLEEPLVRTLRRHDLTRPKDPVVLQSFEVGNLRQLDRMTRVQIAQLVDAAGGPADQDVTYAEMITPRGLRGISRYADWVAPNLNLVLPRDAAGAVGAPSSLVRDAHQAHLRVVGWTLRVENQFLPTNYREGTDPNAPGNYHDLAVAYYDTGIDALFSDNPDLAVQARDDWAG